MKKNYKIEIVSSKFSNKKIKVDLLKNLCEKVLEEMQYEVHKEVRKKELDVELIAKHKVNQESIFIKCKAYKENVSPSDIRQLVGRLFFQNIECGWLFTTAPLGKDAKVLKRKAQESPFEKKLSYYTPDKIIELLISAKKIIDPIDIRLRRDLELDDNITLLVSEYAYYWIVPIIISESISKVVLFSAEDGKQVFDKKLLEDISNMDTSFKDVKWSSENVISNNKNIFNLFEKGIKKVFYLFQKKMKKFMYTILKKYEK